MQNKKKPQNNQHRKILTTADGSKSIYIEAENVQYHSKHGAILEAQHVFIHSGLHFILQNNSKPISIFEMGLGTGLNCILTAIEALKNNMHIDYTAIEAFPVKIEEVEQLNFHQHLPYTKSDFLNLHQLDFGSKHLLNQYFSFTKIYGLFENYKQGKTFDLVYFDAFGANAQPELWTKKITDQLYRMINWQGIMVTYSVKGSFRRNLLESGFTVEKIGGPPGKREMLRAIKTPC
ncbi:tRNA (5-methylaminomethyl-2-thiouridine)(34)-methyltransferase MnmD [Psychroflexus salis]|uniref:MnmC-like methyltransferase domain-containing protein n=1 Tax=Psychroflexus salis TaxID=1526574 RepID=A0A916ZV57_9FLAO|nr:tRNA (5-methylaminomethyl-2-thiouridine)(34)-methyltransferase MnmD [Psychroflexus salis]GGE14298.1 hypothetical protein GCM10010831_14590 [Psychroflexus salis]